MRVALVVIGSIAAFYAFLSAFWLGTYFASSGLPALANHKAIIYFLLSQALIGSAVCKACFKRAFRRPELQDALPTDAVPTPDAEPLDVLPAFEKWYYVRNNQRAGPIGTEQLKELIRSGQLAAGDMLVREGNSTWLSVSAARQFYPQISPADADVAPVLPAHTPAALPPTASYHGPLPDTAPTAATYSPQRPAVPPVVPPPSLPDANEFALRDFSRRPASFYLGIGSLGVGLLAFLLAAALHSVWLTILLGIPGLAVGGVSLACSLQGEAQRSARLLAGAGMGLNFGSVAVGLIIMMVSALTAEPDRPIASKESRPSPADEPVATQPAVPTRPAVPPPAQPEPPKDKVLIAVVSLRGFWTAQQWEKIEPKVRALADSRDGQMRVEHAGNTKWVTLSPVRDPKVCMKKVDFGRIGADYGEGGFLIHVDPDK